MTGFLLILSNLLFVLLFARLFIRDDSPECIFNPVVLATDGVTNRIIDFAAPLFPGMKRKFVIGVTLVFLLLFRGAVMASVRSFQWAVTVGSMLRFFPKSGWPWTLAFGFIEFFVFLVNFWGMAVFVSFVSPPRVTSRVWHAIGVYARPLSLLPRWPGLVAVIVANGLGAYALVNFADGVIGGHPLHGAFDTSTVAKTVEMYVGVALFSLCDILSFVRQALIITIFASLFAAIIQRRDWVMFFIELQNTLLGFCSRWRINVGAFDFTPVIFFLALNFIYGLLISVITFALKYNGVIAAGGLAIQQY